MLPPSHPAGRYRVSRAGVGGRPTRDQAQKRQREAEQGASLLGAFLAAPLKRSRAEDPGSSSSVELPAASAPPPAALSPSSPLGEPAQEAEALSPSPAAGRVAQYIIRNTKQIQKQNSIKHNTRTPGKCIIVYYFPPRRYTGIGR